MRFEVSPAELDTVGASMVMYGEIAELFVPTERDLLAYKLSGKTTVATPPTYEVNVILR